jgi:hypothetical protein
MGEGVVKVDRVSCRPSGLKSVCSNSGHDILLARGIGATKFVGIMNREGSEVMKNETATGSMLLRLFIHVFASFGTTFLSAEMFSAE